MSGSSQKNKRSKSGSHLLSVRVEVVDVDVEVRRTEGTRKKTRVWCKRAFKTSHLPLRTVSSGWSRGGQTPASAPCNERQTPPSAKRVCTCRARLHHEAQDNRVSGSSFFCFFFPFHPRPFFFPFLPLLSHCPPLCHTILFACVSSCSLFFFYKNGLCFIRLFPCVPLVFPMCVLLCLLCSIFVSFLVLLCSFMFPIVFPTVSPSFPPVFPIVFWYSLNVFCLAKRVLNTGKVFCAPQLLVVPLRSTL